MAAGRKLGEAYIAVTADARSVGKDLSAEAEKALTDAARAMGETLDEELADAAARGLEGLGPAVEDTVTRSTERAGGKMAGVLSKRLAAALSNLPEITIQADATEADLALASVRERLNSLQSARIGVDVSATSALAQLDIMQAELAQLSSSDIDVSVRVDANAAAAELAAVTALVSGIDGTVAETTVRADTSQLDRIPGAASSAGGGLGLLAAAALAVSPALIAIGAAAIAGIGLVGPLAVGAAAGLGAMLLGFSGVGDAVKLITQQQDTLATASTKSAGSQVSNAGAVESATRSLANAQANAADAAVRAAERVSDAEASLNEARIAAADKEARVRAAAASTIQTALRRQADAQADLTDSLLDVDRAQQAVNRALASAQDRFEDLNNSVAENANSQRQAALDVAAAEQYLEKIRRSRRATDAEREAAELAYDVQLQRQKQLETQGRRLAAQQAEADATGVDGADEVRSARERLADAEQRAADDRQAGLDADAAVEQARIDGAANIARAVEEGAKKVADAQDAVTDALREQTTQARQSQFSIEQATAALAAAGAAGAAAGAAGAAGLDALNRQLDKVDPATRKFAQYVVDTMQPAFERLKGAAAAGLLPGVQAGFEAILPLMPRFEAFLGSLGTTVGGVFRELGERLNSPFWSDFFTMLETTAGPAFETVAGAVLDVVEGLAGILLAFAPMQDDVNNGVLDLTERFATWGKELKDSEGFKSFIAYVQENWPKVQAILGNLADLVGNLLEGGAGATPPVLDALIQLTDVLAAIPPDVLVGLISAFIGLQAASAAGGAVSSLTEGLRGLTGIGGPAVDQVASIGDSVVENAGRFSEWKDKLSSAVEVAKGMPDKLRGAATAVSDVSSKVGGAVSSAAGIARSLATTAATTAANAGRIVVSYASIATGATINAAKVAGAWLAQTAATTGTMIVTWAVAVASTVAGWVVLGTQSLIQAARVAAAWLIAMGPIAIVIAAVTGIVYLIVSNWDTIKQVTVDAWNAVVGAVSDAIDGVIVWVKGLPQRALDALSSLGSLISGLAQSAWQWFFDTAVQKTAELIVWAQGLPGRIISAIGNLGAYIRDLAQSAWQWFFDTAVQKTAELIVWAQGLPGRIGSAIGNLGALLYDKGLDLMRGLVNGIESAAGYVGNVGRNIVNSVIKFVNSQVIDRVNNLLEFSIAGIKVDPPDIGRIPLLANGAIVDRPTLAIVGEAGPEAVIPLSSNRAARRDALMDQAGLSGGGQALKVDARQTYIVRDTETAEAVGAVIGVRVVRDIRNGVSSAYTAGSAA